MAFGVNTYTDSGVLQLSSEIPAFYMVASGTTSLTCASPTTPPYLWNSSNFDTTTVYELVFFNTSASDLWVRPPSASPTTKTGITAYFVNTTGATGTRTLNWWAFRSFDKLTAPTSGMGLNVKDTSGVTTFALSQPKILKIVQRIPITAMNSTGSTATLNSSTTTYGFAQYGQTKQYQVFGGAHRDIDGSIGIAVRQSSSTTMHYRTGGRAGKTTTDIYNGGILAADLTGY